MSNRVVFIKETQGDTPGCTYVCQAKMEFAEVARGVLLVLPVRPPSLLAEAAPVPVADLRKEAVICLAELKATGCVDARLVDLLAAKGTEQRVFGHTVLEHHKHPVDCERIPPAALA